MAALVFSRHSWQMPCEVGVSNPCWKNSSRDMNCPLCSILRHHAQTLINDSRYCVRSSNRRVEPVTSSQTARMSNALRIVDLKSVMYGWLPMIRAVNPVSSSIMQTAITARNPALCTQSTCDGFFSFSINYDLALDQSPIIARHNIMSPPIRCANGNLPGYYLSGAA